MKINQSFYYDKDYREVWISLRTYVDGGRCLIEVLVRKISNGRADVATWRDATITFDGKESTVMSLDQANAFVQLIQRAMFWTTCLDASIPANSLVSGLWDKVQWFGTMVESSVDR